MNSPEMSNLRSEDWLPSGWSVSVRVRRSGKKDKQYYAPSGLRFNSKVEVTRHLKTLEGGSPQPTVDKHAVSDVAPAPGKVGLKESVENHNCKEVERSSSGSGEKHNAGFEKSINGAPSPVQDKENTMITENVAKIEGPAASLECKDHKNANAQEFEKNAFGHIKQIASLENIKTSPKHGPNVVVERVVAEGLPAGWIKEVKLTKKKNTVRRDPYYIDPVSGYIFHSMKDVRRYLATGDIGRLASKPKEESPIVELGNDRSSSPSEAKRQKLENSGGVEGTEDESSEKDELMLESVHKEVMAPPPDYSNSSDDQRHDCGRTKCVPCSETEGPQDKQQSMDSNVETSEATKTKQATPKSRKGNEDENSEKDELIRESVHKEVTAPPPDYSKSSDDQRHDCGRTKCVPYSETEVPQEKQQSMDGNIETSEATKSKQAIPKSRKKKSSDMPRRTSSRLAGGLVDQNVQVTRTRQTTGNGVKDEEQKKRVKRGKVMSKSINELCSPVEDILEKNQFCNEKKEDEKVEPKKLACNVVPKEELALPFELPSGDILSDPCIEFAIKTLTGVSFDTNTAIKSCSSAEQPTFVLPPANNNSCFEKVASSSLNLPFGDSWQDPCIEFAIKTLTGAIPIDFDSDIPDLMRQQMNSSQIQERTESNVGMDNFCRTDMLWQHSESANNNSFKQQSGVGPTPQPLNIDMQRPSGSIR